jgi:hypothetical protein
MSFDSEFYASQYPDVATSGLDPAVHFLMYGWAEGRAANASGAGMTPDDMLQLMAGVGDALPGVAAGLDATQLAFLNQANGFDLGGVLGAIDDDLLASFMQGWGANELQYLDGLDSFDLDGTLMTFDPGVLMGMMGQWDDTSNLEYLANLDGFDFGAMMGANPDQTMGFLGGLPAEFQNLIYDDFGAEEFSWLDGAAEFDLAGMMAGNFDFFSGMMSPEEALGLFGSVGGNLNDVVHGLDATDLAFLDSAEGFDLGTFMDGLDPGMMAGFMEGWGEGQLSFLDGLGSFDMAATLGEFDPETMASMMGGWDDPDALGFIGGLEGFDFAGMLDQMPEDMVGGLLGEWDSGMFDMLGTMGGGFDVNSWIADAGDYFPTDFDWGGFVPPDSFVPPDGYVPPDGMTPPTGGGTMPPSGGGTMPPAGGGGTPPAPPPMPLIGVVTLDAYDLA